MLCNLFIWTTCSILYCIHPLQKPRCKTCSSEPHIRSSNHLFLDLSKVQMMHTKVLLQPKYPVHHPQTYLNTFHFRKILEFRFISFWVWKWECIFFSPESLTLQLAGDVGKWSERSMQEGEFVCLSTSCQHIWDMAMQTIYVNKR